MSSPLDRVPDCKVKVRKYVLISRPSRWSQRGDRIVVQSPMTTIPADITEVPVRRFRGEQKNAVCFLPRSDIEKHTSKVYENLRVSTSTTWVEAHGVAMVNSSAQEKFKYSFGDAFWICIGANTADFQTHVPVINLHTFEKGNIPISDVCWYPKIRGPEGELWTLGGQPRKLNHYEMKTFSLFSWVICQILDHPIRRSTKNERIPRAILEDSSTNTVSVVEPEEGPHLLTRAERRSLFAQLYRVMISERINITSTACGPRGTFVEDGVEDTELLRSPVSPAQTDLELWNVEDSMNLPTPTSTSSTIGHPGTRRYIYPHVHLHELSDEHIVQQCRSMLGDLDSPSTAADSTIHGDTPSSRRLSIASSTSVATSIEDTVAVPLQTQCISPRPSHAGLGSQALNAQYPRTSEAELLLFFKNYSQAKARAEPAYMHRQNNDPTDDYHPVMSVTSVSDPTIIRDVWYKYNCMEASRPFQNKMKPRSLWPNHLPRERYPSSEVRPELL